MMQRKQNHRVDRFRPARILITCRRIRTPTKSPNQLSMFHQIMTQSECRASRHSCAKRRVERRRGLLRALINILYKCTFGIIEIIRVAGIGPESARARVAHCSLFKTQSLRSFTVCDSICEADAPARPFGLWHCPFM